MSRSRRIVKLAAEHTETAREWLLRDERGVHERLASDLLRRAEVDPEMTGKSEEEVDEAIATMVALSAVHAQYNEARMALGLERVSVTDPLARSLVP